ncbi:MAG TPA: hypothetical protein VGM98_04590 [Schlesneria sp.]
MDFLSRLRQADEQLDDADYITFNQIVDLVASVCNGKEKGEHDPVEIMRRLPAQYDFDDLETAVRQRRRARFAAPARRTRRASQIVCGILTSSVTSASPGGRTGATNFTFKIWRGNPADAGFPMTRTQDIDDTVGVNRSELTGGAGQFCVCAKIDGESVLLTIGGAP